LFLSFIFPFFLVSFIAQLAKATCIVYDKTQSIHNVTRVLEVYLRSFHSSCRRNCFICSYSYDQFVRPTYAVVSIWERMHESN